jgi:hypothetical protein
MSTELISKDIVDLQDIERLQFLQTLQSDPSQYSQYVSEKSGRIISEVVDTKRAAFVKMYGDVGRTLDMDHNSLAALDRTSDLSNTQEQIIANQAAEQGTVKYNLDLTRRQTEINNWYYENKRETLFVLQMVLLVMLAVTVILGVSAKGWLTQDGADYLMVFVIVVGAGTWLYRWYYTANIRDPRYWSRRTFEQDGKFADPRGELCIGSGGGAPAPSS